MNRTIIMSTGMAAIFTWTGVSRLLLAWFEKKFYVDGPLWLLCAGLILGVGYLAVVHPRGSLVWRSLVSWSFLFPLLMVSFINGLQLIGRAYDFISNIWFVRSPLGKLTVIGQPIGALAIAFTTVLMITVDYSLTARVSTKKKP